MGQGQDRYPVRPKIKSYIHYWSCRASESRWSRRFSYREDLLVNLS